MDTNTVIIIAGIVIALAFNFSNGRNDASNTVATVIATRALAPRTAILIASVCCLAGPFIYSTAVAKTIGKGIVDPGIFTPVLLFIGLIGAVLWVNTCSHYGIPVSSSHALVGGLMGAGLAAGGISAVFWPAPELVGWTVVYLACGAALGAGIMAVLAAVFRDSLKFYAILGAAAGAVVTIPILMILDLFVIKGLLAILLFICVSPILGLIVSYIFTTILTKIMASAKHPTKMNKWFQRAQIVGSGFQAMSLGGNDAQNAMGIIIAILIAAGFVTADAELPMWVIVLSALAIALGLLSDGWKVIKKMGTGITRIRPYQGFSASMSGGMVLSFMTMFGVPVLTTHVATGTIMGTGVTRGAGAVGSSPPDGNRLDFNYSRSRSGLRHLLPCRPAGVRVLTRILFRKAEIRFLSFKTSARFRTRRSRWQQSSAQYTSVRVLVFPHPYCLSFSHPESLCVTPPNEYCNDQYSQRRLRLLWGMCVSLSAGFA
ncbi:MAG TPA: inorganic phosphate transporter [Methanocorpusculum sp.]|nr:inorganic phosphate transporter [Methanocorpusculum sp.]